MSIEIKNLTKIFGEQKAVDNISFNVDEGEIVGFLGPNGAGKSTTMKIATCYLPPTEGTVMVSGINVTENPVDVRKKIGYLPENNPLYLDMYVHEFLRFTGRIHNIRGKKLRERTKEIIGMCGLEREQNKQIGELSKGYRQRVGLAQSLIHDPDVLILDEPTTGLDPNQILEIRKLIKEVSKNKTVIFSTHILQEVQALCSRVIVINRGKLVADDPIESLVKGKKMAIRAEFEENIDTTLLEQIPGVISIQREKDTLIIEVESDIRKQVIKIASEKDLPLVGLTLQEESMEGIFRELTKNEDNND